MSAKNSNPDPARAAKRKVSTRAEQQAAARELKLAAIRAQIEDGSLTIRRMTDEERAFHESRRTRFEPPRRAVAARRRSATPR